MSTGYYETPQLFRWREPGAPPQSPALQIYFMQESHLNAEVTAETGVQSYDSVEMGYVSPMGNPKSNSSVEMRRVTPTGVETINQFNMNRYGEPYKAWKAGVTAESQGTPLKDLLGMTPATAANLKSRGITTIEMLCDAADAAGQDVMGFWGLREQAKKHIANREAQAPIVRVEALEAQHAVREAEMQRQIDELKALVSSLGAGGNVEPVKRGPGRPRKDEAAEAA